jgi:hypothetical protein
VKAPLWSGDTIHWMHVATDVYLTDVYPTDVYEHYACNAFLEGRREQ